MPQTHGLEHVMLVLKDEALVQLSVRVLKYLFLHIISLKYAQIWDAILASRVILHYQALKCHDVFNYPAINFQFTE